jgi:hypothetical protein
MATAVREKLNPSLTLDDIIGGQSQYDPTGGGVNPSYVEDGTRGTSTTSSGRGDPRDFGFVAEDAAASRPGQTGPTDTFQELYGYDPSSISAEDARNLSGAELADLLLATNSPLGGDLIGARPDFFLPPNDSETVVGTGQVPAGTPGAGSSANVLSPDEVQTLIEASPEARQVYQTLDLTPFVEDTWE